MRITAANAQVALRRCAVEGNLVFIVATAAIVDFNDLNALWHAERLGMGKHAHLGSTRMTRHCDGAVIICCLNDVLEHVIDAGKIECLRERLGNAIHQHVTILGFNLAGFQDDEIIRFSQC